VNKNIIYISALCLAVVIAAVSFFVLKAVPDKRLYPDKIDKAALIYDRAKDFAKEKDYNKAINALVVGLSQYPDSKYTEKYLRELASIYHEKGDTVKARYYYSRLLKNFPDVKDASEIRSRVEAFNMDMMLSPAITEDSMEYVVQSGDTLFAIAKKFGTTIGLLKKVNGLKGDLIVPGQKLKVVVSQFSLFVDKSDNILVLRKDGEPLKTYIVSTGKDNSTPVGVFKIEEKMVRPVWYKVNAVVSPDSDEYELGERWMGLSKQGYGIHGTNDEGSIGKQITQGCVRMRNNEVIELYDIVPSGTEVEIVD